LLRWLKTFFSPDIYKDEESAQIARLLQIITFWGIPGLLIIFGIRMVSGENLVSNNHKFFLLLIVSFGLAQFWIRKGYLHFTSLLLMSIAWVGTSFSAWGGDGLRDASLIGYLTIIFSSGLLLGQIETLSFFVLSIVMIWFLAYADATGLRQVAYQYAPYTLARNLTINFAAASMVIYYIVNSLRTSLLQREGRIKEHLQNEAELSQQAGYLNALHETTLGIINRLEIRPLLESILARACELTGTQDGLLELVLPDASALKLELGVGLIAPFEGTLTSKGQGLTGRVWETGEHLIVNDYFQWEHRVQDLFGEFHAMLGVPLKSGDKVIGVLGLLHDDVEKKFTPEQVLLMERLAALASMAINNARMYEESQKELTERRSTQNALRDSEELFRRVFHSSPIAICITTLEEGRLLDANYAYWDLTGYDPKTSIGKNRDEENSWEDPQQGFAFLWKLKEKRSYYNPDNQFMDREGKAKSTISFYEVIQIGEQECIFSMFYDMSGQRQTLSALQKSEARTRALLEAMPDMIVEIIAGGVVQNMVPPKGMEKAMPTENFTGRNVREIFSETVVQQILFAMSRTLETNQMNSFEFEENMAGEKRMMEARLVSSGQQTVMMMIRDITQQKEIEIEREKLINELEIQNEESETLRENLASIVGTFELSEIVERVLDQIKKVIPYDTASVWRIDGEWQRLLVGRDLPPEVPSNDLKIRVDADNSSRPIIYGEKPYVLNNNVQEELPDFKAPHSYINSWLAVPLKTRGTITGLIALDGNHKNQFTNHHADLAVTFANQVAIALENRRLFSDLQTELEERKALIHELERKNAEAETLRESTTIVASSLEISETVHLVLDQIKRVVQYDTASVWLYQGEKVVKVGSHGLPADMETINEYIRSKDAPDYGFWNSEQDVPYILLENLHDDYPIFREPPLDYIYGWLGISLRARGKLTGFIALDSSQPGNFTEQDARVVVTFAEQVSIALENARLFSDLQAELEERSKLITELETKNVESETLRESTAIVASTLEISETVRLVLDQIRRVVQYDTASVWLYQDEKAVRVGGYDLPSEMDTKSEYMRNEKNPDYGFWSNENDVPYILLDDLQNNYPLFRKPPLNYIHGWLGVSLHARGKLTGFIALDSLQPGKFTEQDAKVAVTFAEQVSIALENAHLFSDLQSELEERSKLIQELEIKNIESETLRESAAIVTATLEKNEAINLILEQLERVVPYDSASVQLVSGNKLVIVSAMGHPIPEEEKDRIFEIDESEPSTPVLRGNAPYVLFDDVQLQLTTFLDTPHNRIHAWMAVPLKVKGQVLGLIALDGYQAGKFTEKHAQLAVTYANQVAIALENARLFSDLESELAVRKDLILELESKNAELERFTYTVSHDLKSPLFTIRGFLGYLEKDAISGNHERMKSDMKRISDATDKMMRLLNELLELSRVGRVSNESTIISFDELAREAVELVHGRIVDAGITVNIHPNLPSVYGDRQRLLEVVQNLVDNATKFMGNEKEPRIEIGQEGEEDGKPIFFVRDNGIGISPEHYDRVFGLFNKLDIQTDGTGIGLALVKRIVEVHAGRIWVQSEAGKGSTFYFSLPASPMETSNGV